MRQFLCTGPVPEGQKEYKQKKNTQLFPDYCEYND